VARSGPPYFGRRRCLEGSKRHPETVYCCVLHDGVYRTSDAGTSWEHIFEGDARAVAVDPSDDGVVYVGTEPVRLYRSEDRGDTWEELKNLLGLPDEVQVIGSRHNPSTKVT
jgi:photosystem II stability/assembly factor-like uncharacterized protein